MPFEIWPKRRRALGGCRISGSEGTGIGTLRGPAAGYGDVVSTAIMVVRIAKTAPRVRMNPLSVEALSNTYDIADHGLLIGWPPATVES